MIFFFYSQKGWETFQTILEHPLEHKMKVHEEQYASCLFFFFVSTCSVKCHFIFFFALNIAIDHQMKALMNEKCVSFGIKSSERWV